MKKLLLIFITLYVFNVSLSHGSSYRSGDWGVVVKVTPISEQKIYQKPRYKKVCHKNNNHDQKTANMIIGGIVGSVIGNHISGKDGAGTIGAVFGSLIGSEHGNSYETVNCYEETFYTTEVQNIISYYRIKVRTRNGFMRIKSSHSYNVHDVISLNKRRY